MFKNKKGFSLTELIVIIAVMAVLAAVLAPSLLQYTERSRAQKDGVKVADVSGAFNGTNLNNESQASKGSGTLTYEYYKNIWTRS